MPRSAASGRVRLSASSKASPTHTGSRDNCQIAGLEATDVEHFVNEIEANDDPRSVCD